MNYKQLLHQIDTFVFDVDGVLTNGDVLLLPPDRMLRTMSTRDGFAIQYAIKKGYRVAIITGGNDDMVKVRLEYLGVKDVYMGSRIKTEAYDHLKTKYQLSDEQIAYMGDDLPDYHVMRKTGLSACPHDAAEEIKAISHYISPIKGGKGCVRDLIEQVLKVQQKWFDPNQLEW
jgi:3-deoxy-D-manno-octulosonate 8-phosphate phosphatase (KDO 8-P phosphatase)